MNEATVAPLNTDLPVAPAQAPIADAPAPVVASVAAARGRVALPRTVAIRSLLDDSNGEQTFATAEPILKALGFADVDANTFNVTKSAWKRARLVPATPKVAKLKLAKTPKVKAAKAPKAAKVKAPKVVKAVSIDEAVAYITEAGGLVKAEADVVHRQALVKAFRKLAKQLKKVA